MLIAHPEPEEQEQDFARVRRRRGFQDFHRQAATADVPGSEIIDEGEHLANKRVGWWRVIATNRSERDKEKNQGHSWAKRHPSERVGSHGSISGMTIEEGNNISKIVPRSRRIVETLRSGFPWQHPNPLTQKPHDAANANQLALRCAAIGKKSRRGQITKES